MCKAAQCLCKSAVAEVQHCIWIALGHIVALYKANILHQRLLPAGSAHLHASSDIHDLPIDIAGLCRPTQDLRALCVYLALRTKQALTHEANAYKNGQSQCRSAELAPRPPHSHSHKRTQSMGTPAVFARKTNGGASSAGCPARSEGVWPRPKVFTCM